MTSNEITPRPDIGKWDTKEVDIGTYAEVMITVSESYAGADIKIPVYVWRSLNPGPTVFVSGAVHGDEINGTGAIRHIITEQPFELSAGALILVPVVNLMGFERHSRYLPDRRDLNRCFPGIKEGSLASRLARAVFQEIVLRSDYGIDLHTAAVRRTNFPNIRADMKIEKLADFARAFGTELIVSGPGPKGSLRRAASKAGCYTLTFEAGEVWKVEPTVVEYIVRGLRNCLIYLGMVEGEAEKPPYQLETNSTKWLRAHCGGFLQFHVSPGEIVEKGRSIATNTSLIGKEHNVITSPRTGVVLGMTTLPSVAPGDPICHLAYSRIGTLKKIEQVQKNLIDNSLHERTKTDLASSMLISHAVEDDTVVDADK